VDTTRSETLGRDDELAALAAFLDSPLPAALVLEGQAGIGKTTLFEHAVAEGAARGFRVLACRPAEAESQLGFAGLADLLEGALDDAVRVLPRPQQRALRVALFLEEPRGQPPERRAIAAATLGALRALTADGRVLVAIDDVQWLDPGSESALEFAIRRLGSEPLALLLAQRTPNGSSLALAVGRALDESRLLRIPVGPLSVGALHRLLGTRLAVSLPRPLLRRIFEISGGNPFFALELARYLERRGIRFATSEALPLPDGLTELVHDSLEALTDSTRETLGIVAALANPTRGILEAALGRDGSDAVDDAVAAGALEVDRDRLRFTHPLLAAGIYAALAPGERRRLHARLAATVPTREEQARHLALASDQPDAEVARAVDLAIADVRARGGWATAAELAEEALRLTPKHDVDDAVRRRIEASALHAEAGDGRRAIELVEEGLAASTGGVRRGRLLYALAVVKADAERLELGTALATEALVEAKTDTRLQAEIEAFLAENLRMVKGMNVATRHARRAVDLAESSGDSRLLARALAAFALIEFNSGRGVSAAAIDRALALEATSDDAPNGPARITHGHVLYWSGRLDAARAHFKALIEDCRRRDVVEFTGLWYLSQVEFRAGNWERARALAAEAHDLPVQLGLEGAESLASVPLTTITAHLGEVEQARAYADRGLALARASGNRPAIVLHRGILGFMALSSSDPTTAAGELERAEKILRPLRIRDPGMFTILPDRAEALAALGEPDGAAKLLRPWAQLAETLEQRWWCLAIAARCRGIICAARGDLDEALTEFAKALSHHELAGDPFQLGRTVLALGSTQRRARQRREARASLERACSIFEDLGARLWAENARTELHRVSGRAGAAGDLTPSEERVASLVARGRTNREVAAELFLSVKTVESNLKAIYRKLEIRSRTELARLFAARAAGVKDP